LIEIANARINRHYLATVAIIGRCARDGRRDGLAIIAMHPCLVESGALQEGPSLD
jgi:hypothetical protein